METGRILILYAGGGLLRGHHRFYIGRAYGKKKLAPRISPAKTVEGGLGAVAGSVAGAVLSKLLFFPQLPLVHALILGVAVGGIGQLGDLWESLLKRSAQVKDSGALIPGHGGLLDRIDSVLFATPLVYYYAWRWGSDEQDDTETGYSILELELDWIPDIRCTLMWVHPGLLSSIQNPVSSIFFGYETYRFSVPLAPSGSRP
jgi:hypothetical protein